MPEWFITFNYNEYGRGDVEIHNNSLVSVFAKARTGSISHHGNLVNKIMPGIWTIRGISVDTTERAMEWETGFGWKVRLWTPKGNWSRFLIHPDGDKLGRRVGNGTAGCIGTRGNCLDLRYKIDEICKFQDQIKVYVNTPYPKD